MKLYEIQEAVYAILSRDEFLDSETGEILDADDLDALDIALADKLEGCGLYIKNSEAMANAIKEEEQRLRERRASLERRIESIKQYMRGGLELAGGKVETPRIRLSFRRSKAVEILDQGALPDEFIRVSVKEDPDKKMILAALKAGQEVPGAALDERLSLQIR